MTTKKSAEHSKPSIAKLLAAEEDAWRKMLAVALAPDNQNFRSALAAARSRVFAEESAFLDDVADYLEIKSPALGLFGLGPTGAASTILGRGSDNTSASNRDRQLALRFAREKFPAPRRRGKPRREKEIPQKKRARGRPGMSPELVGLYEEYLPVAQADLRARGKPATKKAALNMLEKIFERVLAAEKLPESPVSLATIANRVRLSKNSPRKSTKK